MRVGSVVRFAAAVCVAAAGGVQGQSCAAPAKTLTLSCGSACKAFEPCLLRAGSSSCGLECFTINSASPSAYKTFNFLIPYDASVGDTATTAFKSNSALTSIAKLKLPGSTTEVNIRGGSFLHGSSKGTMASVEIASDFMAENTQLMYLRLVNLNLQSAIDRLAANFPPLVQHLSLENAQLTAFPAAVTSLKKILDLSLTDNYITRIDDSHSMSQLEILLVSTNSLTSFSATYPVLRYLDLAYNNIPVVPGVISQFTHLTTLHLSNNPITEFKQTDAPETLERLGLFQCNLRAFDAYFPNLEYLHLYANKLTAFPVVVFRLPYLDTLYLNLNPIRNVKFTNAQANFINTLSTFEIDAGAFSTDCDVSQRVQVKSYTVCITSDEVDKVVTQSPAPAGKVPTTPKKTRTKKPASGQTSTTETEGEAGGESSGEGLVDPTPVPETAAASATGGSTISKSKAKVAGVAGSSSSSEATDSSTASAADSSASGTKSKKSKKDKDAITNTVYENSRASTSVPAIIGYIAGGVGLIAVAVFIIARKKKRNRESIITMTNTTARTGTSFGSKGSYVSVWNDPNLLAVKVRSEDIEDVKKIGQGAFCEVWLVIYRGSQQLASKRLKEVSRNGTRAFTQEIKLVATLQHPCIVSFVGAAWTQEADLQALFEFMEGGDLRTYLVEEMTPRSWTLEKVQIAINIVEALVYIHSFSPPLVHRDLKSRNVLLSETNQAKLTDFGVSRYQSQQNTMTAGVGTVKWLAPEVISGQSDYGPAADIYSFGVVLSELDTHNLPYNGFRGTDGYKLADVAVMEMVTTGELQPEFQATCPVEIAQLAMRCLSLRAVDRPSAVDVAYTLRTFRQSAFGEQM